MNENQKLFVREYLKDFNGTRAYKVAYKTKDDRVAGTGAWRMLKNVEIQKAIHKQANKTLEEVEVDVNYIVGNIKEVVERCMTKDESGKFDANNSLKGLELLGKYKSIFKDNVDVSVKSSKKFDEICSQLGGDGLDD